MPAPEIIILRQGDGFILRTDGRVMRSKDGIYTTWELDDLIYNQGYIPVASGAELDSLRNTGSRTMGAGTIWAGSYATGVDKKYVQVKNVDLSGFSNFSPLGAPTTLWLGVYNGNRLVIDNLTLAYGNIQDIALFGVIGGESYVTLENIIITNASATSTATSIAILASQAASAPDYDTIIRNCYVYNSVVNSASNVTTTSAGLVAVNWRNTTGYSGAKIINCHFTGSVKNNGITAYSQGARALISGCSFTSTTSMEMANINAGICGENYATIEDSWANFTSASINDNNAGIVGVNRTGAITRRCYATGTISTATARIHIGGVVGLNDGTVQDCWANVSISGPSGSVGGLVGRHRAGTISNSYSIGAITATGSNVGGLVGLNAATITNSYYDSQTSGRSDTGKGLPRTTAQMKAGTASSFILANGDIDPDSLAANAMYTSWDTAIWDFLTTNDYPILK